MIPIRKSKHLLVVDLIRVGELGVMNDERRAQSIGVLSICVRVVPVGAGLLDLQSRVSLASYWAC